MHCSARQYCGIVKILLWVYHNNITMLFYLFLTKKLCSLQRSVYFEGSNHYRRNSCQELSIELTCGIIFLVRKSNKNIWYFATDTFNTRVFIIIIILTVSNVVMNSFTIQWQMQILYDVLKPEVRQYNYNLL